jgi:hypothetical protein
LGFPRGEEKERLQAVLAEILEWALRVTFEPFRYTNNTMTGYIRVRFNLSRAVMSKIAEIEEAYIETEKGKQLPWLRWLLFFGSGPIVFDYKISFRKQDLMRHHSRSGLAVMIRTGNSTWSVPPPFAGDVNDNFLTQAFSELKDTVRKKVEQGIKVFLWKLRKGSL